MTLQLSASKPRIQPSARPLRPSTVFSFAETPEEFREVLELRFREYSAAGKVPAGVGAESMTDEFDRKAKIVIGRRNGRIVCSLRIIYHSAGEVIEQGRYVNLPESFPRPDELVEVTRACVSSEFRGSSLFLLMLIFLGVTVVPNRRIRWVVICATEKMAGVYERVGFRRSGLSYPHAGLNGLEHHVMTGEVTGLVTGRGMDPRTWIFTWARVYSAPGARAWLAGRLTRMDRLRAALYLKLPVGLTKRLGHA